MYSNASHLFTGTIIWRAPEAEYASCQNCGSTGFCSCLCVLPQEPGRAGVFVSSLYDPDTDRAYAVVNTTSLKFVETPDSFAAYAEGSTEPLGGPSRIIARWLKETRFHKLFSRHVVDRHLCSDAASRRLLPSAARRRDPCPAQPIKFQSFLRPVHAKRIVQPAVA